MAAAAYAIAAAVRWENARVLSSRNKHAHDSIEWKLTRVPLTEPVRASRYDTITHRIQQTSMAALHDWEWED